LARDDDLETLAKNEEICTQLIANELDKGTLIRTFNTLDAALDEIKQGNNIQCLVTGSVLMIGNIFSILKMDVAEFNRK